MAVVGSAHANPTPHHYHWGDWSRVRSSLLGVLTVATLVGALYADIRLPDGVAAWAPYCLAIVFALHWKGAPAILGVAMTALVFLVLGQWLGPIGDLDTGVINRAIGAATILGLSFLCLYIDFRRQAVLRTFAATASSRSRLRLFVDSLQSAGVVLSDLRGRVTEWSQGAQHLTGYRGDHMVGRPLHQALPRQVHPAARWSEVCHRARSQGKAVREDAYQRRDGSWCWLHSVIRPLRNRFGRLRGYSVVIHDSTQSGTAAPLSGDRVSPLSPPMNGRSSLVVYRCRYDSRRDLRYVDEEVGRLIGTTNESGTPLPPRSLGTWVHPEDRERVWNTIETAVEAKRTYVIVYRMISATGDEKWVWDEGEAERAEDGNVIGLEGYLAEIA